MRTIVPSGAKSFSHFDFCRRCYEILDLDNLELKELDEYFSSLSSESNEKLFQGLIAVASKFDCKEHQTVLSGCIRVFVDPDSTPRNILAFLLAAKALADSKGSEPLNTVGKLAIINMSFRLASDLIASPAVSEDLTEEEILEKVCEVSKHNYSVCLQIAENIPPSDQTEFLRENLEELKEACDYLTTPEKVDLSAVEEGIHIECIEELTDVLIGELGDKHTFQGWGEFKYTLQFLQKDFAAGNINLVIPDREYDGPIHLLVDEGEIYITTQWENIKESIQKRDIEYLVSLEEGIPFFVLEKAAGGIENLEEFAHDVLSKTPESTDAAMLYVSLLEYRENIQEAIQFLETRCTEFSEPDALLKLAIFFIEAEEPEKALSCFEKVHQLEPENWTIPARMGRLYEGMNNFEEAHTYYKKALELDPSNPVLIDYAAQTETAATISKIEKLMSEEAYEKALELVDTCFDPFDISIFHYYKGTILSRMRESKKALELITDYLDIYPEDEEGWLEKAGIYLDLGRCAAAARCFRRCSSLDSGDIRPIVWEALCYKQLGRSRDYKRCINKAKRIDAEGTKKLLKSLPF